jgi:hypothetical protein
MNRTPVRDPMSPPQAMTPELALRTARILALAMPLGVLSLWAVAWYLTSTGSAPLSPGSVDARTAAYAWTGLAVAGLAGALFFRNRAVGAIESARPEDRGTPAVLGQVNSFLIIAWALLEAPGLLAGIIYLLLGLDAVLLYALPIYLVGLALTFPRAEWYGVANR